MRIRARQVSHGRLRGQGIPEPAIRLDGSAADKTSKKETGPRDWVDPPVHLAPAGTYLSRPLSHIRVKGLIRVHDRGCSADQKPFLLAANDLATPSSATQSLVNGSNSN
jgi:hypothetical protein